MDGGATVLVETEPLPFDPRELHTPALVIDEGAMVSAARRFVELAHASGCQALYSLKALSLPWVLERLAPSLDGFSVSSLFEARLARECLGDRGTLQFVSPGLSLQQAPSVARLCDRVSFNSVPQWRRLRSVVARGAACGLRVNPGLSFVDDPRFDPCRPGSKLGIPLEQMPRDAAGLGLHLHNNCESTRIDELVCTVQRLREARPDLLEGADWFNLGGGYLFDDARDTHRLREAVALLGADVSRPVFLEPGAALVQAAGFLVTSVTDCFRGDDGALMAILDTSVNHLPEVLEFQYQPRLAGIEPGRFRHSLAGASCLVGDLFGDYDLSAPLEPGARLTFLDAGSYSFVKSHMFNGINLPTLYSVTNEGDLLERRRFDYGDFLTRCGGPANAC
jgi:carboxynorspermidine decarboxylase